VSIALASPARVQLPLPMLASPQREPFSRPGWWFEVKYDGMRALLGVDGEGLRVVGRRGREETFRFPEVEALATRLQGRDLVLDSEVIVPDAQGRPQFERLQSRINVSSPRAAQRAAAMAPATFCSFDLLRLDGQWLLDRPLSERKERLLQVIEVAGPPLLYADHVEEEGEAFFRAAAGQGLEGMVAKRAASTYQAGRRSPDWIKVKAWLSQSCAVIGVTEGHDRPGHLGALVVAVLEGGHLVHCGEVGGGLSEQAMRTIIGRIEGLRCEATVVQPAPRMDEAVVWVRPELICEVRHAGFTRSGTLRQPTFLGLRPDATVEDCGRAGPEG